MRIKILARISPIETLIDSIAQQKSDIIFPSQSDALQAWNWLNGEGIVNMLKRGDVYRSGERTYRFILSFFSITCYSLNASNIKIAYTANNDAPSVIINGSSEKGIHSFERAVYYMFPSVSIIDFSTTPKNYYLQLTDWRNFNKYHGDYFKYSCILKSNVKIRAADGTRLMLSNLDFKYRNSFQNEQRFRREVANLTSSLLIRCSSDYDKIKAIYRYVVNNVVYDYSLSKYSAYDALINGMSVCEGIALLLNTMLRHANIVTRIVTGLGKQNNHGWNIVCLNGLWYNLDATWDLGKRESLWQYFLRGASHFPDHQLDTTFIEEFRRDKIVISYSDYK